MVGPRCWDLGGGGVEGGGGSLASQVSALDRASFGCRWRWGSAFLKAKTRWGFVSPVVGVVMASYRVEGTRNLKNPRLSPGWEHWAHQMLATWLKGGGHACMKLCTMWSALGQWDKKEATSRGCDCAHVWQIGGVKLFWHAYVRKFMLPDDHLKGSPEKHDE